MREARRVRFGKPVFPETLDLLEDALEIIVPVAACEHAAPDLVVKAFEPAAAFPRGHRAPQLVGFAGREAGDDFDQTHDLFLEDRHAERAFENGPDAGSAVTCFALDARLRIFDVFQTVPAAQIRMHHIALDRTWPDDRDL